MVIHVFLGVSFILLGVVRGAGTEYTLFGVLALVGGAFEMSTELHYTHAAVAWTAVRMCTGVTFGVLALDLATRLGGVQDRFRALVRGGYVYAAVAAGIAASGGWLTGRGSMRHIGAGVLALAYRESDMNILGDLTLAPVPLLIGVTTWVLFAAALRGERWVWPVAVSQAVLAVAAVMDLATAIFHLHFVYVSEHATFVFVFGVSYALLGRLVERAAVSTAELRRSQESLAAVQSTLARREPLAVVGELSAMVAHEIRNPLAVLTNAAASLRRAEISSEDRSLLLQIVSEECGRLNRIVHDMLTLARPMDPERRPADVRDLVARSLGPAQRDRAAVDLEVRFASDADGLLLCDAHLLRQALENVVDNAVQAMDVGGTLSIYVSTVIANGVRGREFAVVDSGEGMITEVRNRATRPFFTTRTTGTGLGLAIVERILAAHGGAVRIESARGAGTTVRLFVPEGG